MTVQRYPFLVRVYKGENRIFINPMVNHIGGYSIASDWFINITNSEDYIGIGKAIRSSIEFIKNSPISAVIPKEWELNAAWKKNSKYKSWTTFWKNNLFACVKFNEDGSYKIYSLSLSEKKIGLYGDYIEERFLSADTDETEIGRSIIEVLEASEEFHKNRKVNENVKEIELLNNSKIRIKPLLAAHFEDNEDCNAGEIYQCYSYMGNDDAEAVADFFIGIAPELDCNLNKDNVRSSWEEYYGKATVFEMKKVDYGIFKLRAEMRNKESHKISYFLKQEEDLILECGMEVRTPNRRKKTDEKLTKVFEDFALSCKM